jgi:hypothetical protein
MKQITEQEARNTVIELTGDDIAPICMGGRTAYGDPVSFYDDHGNIVVKDKGTETVWEYDFHGRYLRHRGFGSSRWVAWCAI